MASCRPRQQQKLAVLVLGLDGFRKINERLGRRGGDDLLRSVSEVLQQSLRQGDTIARLGGDEFTIILSGIKRDEDVAKVAEKLRLSLRSPFAIGGQTLLISASMGVALYPDDGPDSETLLKSAAVAMSRAKDQGGDTFDIHAPETSAAATEHLAFENALRKALVRTTRPPLPADPGPGGGASWRGRAPALAQPRQAAGAAGLRPWPTAPAWPALGQWALHRVRTGASLAEARYEGLGCA
jgi:diguanylate cyclase (GGDEF)-like protein